MNRKCRKSHQRFQSSTDRYTVQPGLRLWHGLFTLVTLDMGVFSLDFVKKVLNHSNACVIGFVNKILSWRGFLPLSRVSYCMYLIHYDYLTVFYAENRKLIYYTFLSQLTTYFGVVLTVYMLAVITSAMVEAPFINLEKLFLSPKSMIRSTFPSQSKVY